MAATRTDDPLVYLNGEIMPLSEAKIPVLDRGFIFGDGVYDVVPIYRRKPFRADQHIARLLRSMEAISIPDPHGGDEWLKLVQKIADAHPADDQLVYIQVTRGVAKRSHAFPKDIAPTVFIMTSPHTPPSEEIRARGVSCVTMEDRRWLRCDIKSISLLGNVLAAQYAAEQGAVEAIQFRDGFLSEGSASNAWIVRDGGVIGPQKDNLVLEGIRYGLIAELCAAEGIRFELRRIDRAEVFAADEVFLSSAGKEVLPVTSIDGAPVGNGTPGPVCRRLYLAYQAAKNT
jgi:D-alanine transaminase